MHTLQIKRAYEDAADTDGYRILVDKLWPRGVSKEELHMDLWEKEIAPSNELRKSFGHVPEKFAWFTEEYHKELAANPISKSFAIFVKEKLQKQDVTLVYGAKDTEHNQAVVLRDWLLKD